MSDDFDAVLGLDRIPVKVDGEEIEVFNHATVERTHYINSVNGYESGQLRIYEADSVGGDAPDAITERLAQWLEDEFDWDRTDSAIRVIDVTDDAVTRL